MKLVSPAMIAEIDAFAVRALSLSEETLIRRAGKAVADALFAEGVFLKNETYGRTVILCGGGNNGADGYAAALSLAERGVPVAAIDVFGKEQRSEGGKAVLQEYKEKLGAPLTLADLPSIEGAGVYIDAMLGTGATGKWPEAGIVATRFLNRQSARRIAVDVPFGVNAADGTADECALQADITVVLSFMKKGLLSYPAREKCGKLVLADIGLNTAKVRRAFPKMEDAVDDGYVMKHLPARPADSHKGTFGKALLFSGSKKYRGAPLLATLACLRGGVGLLTLVSEKEVIAAMGKKLPETIYHPMPPIEAWTEADRNEALEMSDGASALLVGPGSCVSEGLYAFVTALLSREGCPLVLDADAITSLALHPAEAEKALAAAKRQVLLTPHPLEFARLACLTAQEVQAARMPLAEALSSRWRAALLLKGAGTVVAADGSVSVNTTGSSALAKGGSGDVLSGLVTAFAAQGASPAEALRLGAYLHGKAGDALAAELSEYGVLPSDLPRQIAMEIAKIKIEASK